MNIYICNIIYIYKYIIIITVKYIYNYISLIMKNIFSSIKLSHQLIIIYNIQCSEKHICVFFTTYHKVDTKISGVYISR